jgi:hypothetical protein
MKNIFLEDISVLVEKDNEGKITNWNDIMGRIEYECKIFEQMEDDWRNVK